MFNQFKKSKAPVFSKSEYLSAKGLLEEDELLERGCKFFLEKDYDNALYTFEKVLMEKGSNQVKAVEQLRCLLEIYLEPEYFRSKLKLTSLKKCCELIQKSDLDDKNTFEQLALARKMIYIEEQKERLEKMPEDIPFTKNYFKNFVIENLVFQGGGIKGVAYLGAIKALNEQVDLRHIKRYAGTSAGSIIAVLLGIGFSLRELEEWLKKKDFSDFMDGHYRNSLLKLIASDEKERLQIKAKQVKNEIELISDSNWKSPYALSNVASLSFDPDVNIIKAGLRELTKDDPGLFPGDNLRMWIEERIQERTGIAYLTFAELHELVCKNPEQGYRDVYLIGANISTYESEIFCYETTPNVVISDAVRASVSIPLVFYPCQLHVKGDDGKRIVDERGCWYVDGGIIENYPLSIFDKPSYISNQDEVKGETSYGFINQYTLGFRLVNEEDKIRYEKTEKNAGNKKVHKPPKGLANFLWDVLMTIHNRQETLHVERQEVIRTIYIDHLGISPIKFNLEASEQEALIKNGQGAVESYLERRFNVSNLEYSHENCRKQNLTNQPEKVVFNSLKDSGFKPLTDIDIIEHQRKDNEKTSNSIFKI